MPFHGSIKGLNCTLYTTGMPNLWLASHHPPPLHNYTDDHSTWGNNEAVEFTTGMPNLWLTSHYLLLSTTILPITHPGENEEVEPYLHRHPNTKLQRSKLPKKG
jgi:hypothetical protein